MSIPYEHTGRRAQKSRTRAALIEAAKELLGQGITPTVEQAAAAAAVSRPTAYRYFPNQQKLLSAAHPEVDLTSLLDGSASHDPLERLEAVSSALTGLLLEHEHGLRAMLRFSLEERRDSRQALALRAGRRIAWISDALKPIKAQTPPCEYDRLVLAISAALGIESLVWLTDVAGLERVAATELMRWSAHQLLRAAL